MFTANDAHTLLAMHHLRADELRAEASTQRLARSLPDRSDRPRSWLRRRRPGRHRPGHARAGAMP